MPTPEERALRSLMQDAFTLVHRQWGGITYKGDKGVYVINNGSRCYECSATSGEPHADACFLVTTKDDLEDWLGKT